jgi:hypothetical protein
LAKIRGAERGFLMVNCGEFVVNRWILEGVIPALEKCHFLKIYFSGFPFWEWMGHGETVRRCGLSIGFGEMRGTRPKYFRAATN